MIKYNENYCKVGFQFFYRDQNYFERGKIIRIDESRIFFEWLGIIGPTKNKTYTDWFSCFTYRTWFNNGLIISIINNDVNKICKNEKLKTINN